MELDSDDGYSYKEVTVSIRVLYACFMIKLMQVLEEAALLSSGSYYNSL